MEFRTSCTVLLSYIKMLDVGLHERTDKITKEPSTNCCFLAKNSCCHVLDHVLDVCAAVCSRALAQIAIIHLNFHDFRAEDYEP